ncbi:astacin, partial [Cooperia oncophora]
LIRKTTFHCQVHKCLARQRFQVTSDTNATLVDGEATIEEINQVEGVAEYLFQGDINLTEEQMGWLEDSMEQKENVTRHKRQVDRGARRWANNRLFYFFDSTVGAKTKAVVKDALTFIRDRTCIDFTESSVATNRVRVFSGAGCFATIGMAGGEQSLSLGRGCELIGIAAHEFAHALGVWHTQMRDDRDSFLRVDLSSVPPNLLHNYVKLPASRIINYTPYEYGSYMHYDSKSFSTRGDSLIPLDATYLRTLGSRIISFYDIKMLNDHYGCNGELEHVCIEKAIHFIVV